MGLNLMHRVYPATTIIGLKLIKSGSIDVDKIKVYLKV